MSYAEDMGYDAYDFHDMPDAQPEIEYSPGKWTDANGKEWAIKNMGHRHIENCIKILNRTMNEWDYLPEDTKEIKKKIREFEHELRQRHQFKGKAF